MKLNYKQRLFLYIAIVFSLFTLFLILFEQARGRAYRTEALTEKLDAYSEIVYSAMLDQPDSLKNLEIVTGLLPQNIRLSVIDKQGNVEFDNSVDNVPEMENHAQRPEITQAQSRKSGTDIRVSASTKQEYLYYAKDYGDWYVRVALPYDIQTKRSLESDNLFLYVILLLFIVVLILMNIIANRFGKSIRQLRDFTQSFGEEELPELAFPDDELGEIGQIITNSYRQLKKNKRAISMEREKLLQHVHSSEEGICFFNARGEIEFYNGLFIQYLNVLIDTANSDPAIILTDDIFAPIHDFLREKPSRYFETQLKRQGKAFSARVNIFEDDVFEVILNDVTRQEKTRLLKQEITGNIAHELRTPVTGIRGYLETLLEQELSEEQARYFITQAYDQTIALSELIRDMSLITKMEEAAQSFTLEKINIPCLLQTLKEDLSSSLDEKEISIQWEMDEKTELMGNKSLLYAIFRNLTDNVIKYAGEQVKINISLYNEDKKSYYFSFSDTGVGIPDESHLNRLFERFYRINEGRGRDTGGSGLGLSIVKNAVLFHKGSIVVKNRAGGGLEFLFRISKE